RKNRPCGVSSIPLLAMRRRLSRTSFKGSLATSPALTNRCSPLAISVTSTAARRAARSAFSACRTSNFPSPHFLPLNPDTPTTGEAHFSGRCRGDTEFEHPRFAVLDHIHRFGHYGALDAAARYGSEEVTLVVDDEVRADGSRR